MATWIVHLTLAERLLKRFPELDAGAFLIGNIAPDSGIPDENWENFSPPPAVTHFKGTGDKTRITDLVFYRRYLPCPDQPQRHAFRLGYFIHLVTDILWAREIYYPTREKFARQFQSEPNFIWKVKRDWYGIDFEVLKDDPQSIFWTQFRHLRYGMDDFDFLPPEAIQRNVDYIQTFYQSSDEDATHSGRPNLYLSTAEWLDFIERTSRRLADAVTFLQSSPDTGEALSVLEFI